MGTFAVIALIAAACLGLGLAVRYWWSVAFACIPSFLWLLFCVPRWTEESDGGSGADWFLFGFGYVGAPVIALVALGVFLGRLLFGRPESEAPRESTATPA
jgi:hypothetical protein